LNFSASILSFSLRNQELRDRNQDQLVRLKMNITLRFNWLKVFLKRVNRNAHPLRNGSKIKEPPHNINKISDSSRTLLLPFNAHLAALLSSTKVTYRRGTNHQNGALHVTRKAQMIIWFWFTTGNKLRTSMAFEGRILTFVTVTLSIVILNSVPY